MTEEEASEYRRRSPGVPVTIIDADRLPAPPRIIDARALPVVESGSAPDDDMLDP
jgi:hypothetical protein